MLIVKSSGGEDGDVVHYPIVPVVQFRDPKFTETSYIDDGGATRTVERGHKRDAALGIKRLDIPYRIFLMPRSSQGIRCREIFERLDQLIDIQLVPDTRHKTDLALMLRCVQQKRQVRFLWLANELCDRPAPDLADRYLQHLVTRRTFKQLQMEVPHDIALYHLLKAGEGEIRHWCQCHQIEYPFATPFDLFLEILQEEFAGSLEHCFNFTPFCTNQRKREDEHRFWTAFLNDRFWDDEEENTKYERSNRAIKEELIAVLQASGWTGRAILALWEQKTAEHLQAPWIAYRRAYRQLLPLVADEITYVQGQPTITGTTNHRIPITGETTPEGYILWFRA